MIIGAGGLIRFEASGIVVSAGAGVGGWGLKDKVGWRRWSGAGRIVAVCSGRQVFLWGGGRGCRHQRAPGGPSGPRDLSGSDLLDSASNEEEKEQEEEAEKERKYLERHGEKW